jgi:hypothetical protein
MKKKIERGGAAPCSTEPGLYMCPADESRTLAVVSPRVESANQHILQPSEHEIMHEKKKSGPGATWSDRYSLCACEFLGRVRPQTEVHVSSLPSQDALYFTTDVVAQASTISDLRSFHQSTSND